MLNLAGIMGQYSSTNQNTFKVKIEGTRGKIKRIININYYDPFILAELVATGKATKKEYRLCKELLRVYSNKTSDILNLNNL